MKKILTVAVALGAVMGSFSAQAGLFDSLNELKDAAKVIKDTSDALNGKSGNNNGSSSDSGSSTAGSGDEFPMSLTTYPRAKLERHVVNPFDRVDMPISAPSKRPDGSVRPQYTVPVEGKVDMLQFKHKKDDSPLLIQQHYESWLAAQGFERMLICEKTSCPYTTDWQNAVDPRKRMDAYYLPVEQATYIAGLKDGAMAVVGIAKHYDRYVSLVKVVDGKVTDRSNWDRLNTAKTPPPAVAPSQPAQTMSMTGGVEAISPQSALNYANRSQGLTLIQLTSYDKNCGFCTKTNPEYDALAAQYAGQARFLQVSVQPWRDAFKNEFAKMYGINGVPTTLAFRNGQLVNSVQGYADVNKLKQQLLDQ